VVDAYKAIVHFKAGCHHMYVQSKKESNQGWIPTKYMLVEEEMGHIMVYWDVDWKIPPKNK
jgi:hypothetical protein